MYRRYYSYNDMPQLVSGKREEVCEKKTECEKPEHNERNNKLFPNLQIDDIILGVVILVLLMDDEDNSLLLIALAAIFLTGLA